MPVATRLIAMCSMGLTVLMALLALYTRACVCQTS